MATIILLITHTCTIHIQKQTNNKAQRATNSAINRFIIVPHGDYSSTVQISSTKSRLKSDL